MYGPVCDTPCSIKKQRLRFQSDHILGHIWFNLWSPETINRTFSFPRYNSKLGEMLRKKDKFVATLQPNLVSWKFLIRKQVLESFKSLLCFASLFLRPEGGHIRVVRLVKCDTIVLNVQSHYRKVTQGTLKNPEIFCKFISPSFFEPVSAAL